MDHPTTSDSSHSLWNAVPITTPVPAGQADSAPVTGEDGSLVNEREERQACDLFGMQIDSVDMAQALQRIHEWIEHPQPRCRYVVTPNVDHAVMVQTHAGLSAAYRDADLVLADGHPIVVASRLLRRPLPERVAGSDLVPRLFASAKPHRPIRVFLLGAAAGVAPRAARRIRQQWPYVRPVGVYSPPLGFEHDAEECEYMLGRIALYQPDVLLVGLGAPKQECWVHRHIDSIAARVALCAGATIDFLAGEKRRAPVWMQRTGMEWVHRMCHEPQRLVKRYAKDAWIFPQLVWKQWLEDRQDEKNRDST